MKKSYYLNMFFIFSFIGYLLETCFIKNYESGLLFLPWTPVYGIGIIIGLLIHAKIKDRFAKIIELLLFFVIALILLSIVELTGGYLIEWFFHKVYWNYSTSKYNIGKYLCLESSLTWGIGSLMAVYLVIPLVNKIEKFIPKWLTYSLSVIFIIDIIITCIVKMP